MRSARAATDCTALVGATAICKLSWLIARMASLTRSSLLPSVEISSGCVATMSSKSFAVIPANRDRIRSASSSSVNSRLMKPALPPFSQWRTACSSMNADFPTEVVAPMV